MATTETAVKAGLDGIVVADTRLSDVDGEAGRLVIAGHDVEAIAGRLSFEEVSALLWLTGGAELVPEGLDGAGVRQRLGEARVRAFALLSSLGGALQAADGMSALRAAIAHLAPGKDGPFADAIALTGAMAVFAAAWARTQAGLAPVAPDAAASHAADYLRMVRGTTATQAEIAALDAYLVTVSDHGMNASTFAARVVTSTGSDLVSAAVAALGALKGPLHGGAPGPVLDMLDSVGRPAQAAWWIEAELLAGRRIMGMGHRIYRVRDPRAAVLERAIERLAQAGVSAEKLELARAVEHAAEAALALRHPERPLKANVEFYTAVLLDAVGLPRQLFSPTFAVGRIAGWCAHAFEQARLGRLIRPASRYVGTQPRAA